MHRRSFIRDTALCAVAISTSGFIRFNGNNYIGDCETTTDILGPYYRPGSPVRNDFRIVGDPGTQVELSGTIRHNDCATPYKKAKIELWHCNSNAEYDNTSDEYRYRGTSFSDDDGHYSFNTILPVPYDAGGGTMRPAHFHLMITAEGYQPFITQVYFAGGEYLDTDVNSSAPTSKKRILDVQTANDGTKKVLFDVNMAVKLNAEPAVLNKLAGTYTCEKDEDNKIEFFIHNNLLWKKNKVYGVELEYTGNNTFQATGMAPKMSHTLAFEIMTTGIIKVTEAYDGLPYPGGLTLDLTGVYVKDK